LSARRLARGHHEPGPGLVSGELLERHKNSFGITAADEAREAVDNGNVKMESVVKYLLNAKQELAESTIENANAKSDKATIMGAMMAGRTTDTFLGG
jgi:preprotein translocase subunit SecA